VHGDVWPGNVLVAGNTVRALIDWKTAGVGCPGVDLSELRKQVAIAYGADAPRYVLEGWEQATGTAAHDVPFWDATAALNTQLTPMDRRLRLRETPSSEPRSLSCRRSGRLAKSGSCPWQRPASEGKAH
jgi:aminoglycoside phosphotransferase (APT) family kinase protein